jgi:signal transduction histidine kinase/CheY-like chemotaxis protein
MDPLPLPMTLPMHPGLLVRTTAQVAVESPELRSANQDFNLLLAVTGAILLLAVGTSIGLFYASRRAAVAQAARLVAFRSLDRSHRLLRLVAASLESLVQEDDEELGRAGLLESAGRFFEVTRLRVVRPDPSGTRLEVVAGWSSRETTLPALGDEDRERFPEYEQAVRNRDHAIIETGERTLLIVPLDAGGDGPRGMLLLGAPSPRSWPSEDVAALRTLAFAYERSRERWEAARERERFVERRRGSERAELIAQLASGIAHDFNNILFAATGRLQLLLKRADDPTMRDGLVEIQKTLQSASPLISGLLAAHRGAVRAPGPLELGPELQQVERLARQLLPIRCEVSFDYEAVRGLTIHCDRQGVQQLLLNLVVNARDAVGGRGRIRVGGRRDSFADGREAVTLSVEDDGPGLPEEMRETVLQPFFTTKGEGKGTGLGLSICQRVATEAGGSFALGRSETLGGLKAEAKFPLEAPGGGDPADEADDAPAALAEVNAVLIVEDNATIREVLVKCFEGLGIDTIARGDATEVESILRSSPLRPDIVVMDIDLPKMTGIECLERIRAAGFGLPCLLITGGISEPQRPIANMRLLRKPFRLETLLQNCRILLDEARAG